MAGKVRTRRGAVLLQRLGPLRMGEQSQWNRAPAPRGMWAFPWPAFEMFFAYHQYGYAAPARLRTGDYGLPTHSSAWVDNDGNPAPDHLTLTQLRADDRWQVRADFYAEREAWVRTVGRRVVRRHKFWFTGDLYTHLTERGDVLPLDQWRRMPATTYATAVRRAGADRILVRDRSGVARRKTTADHLEVFLAPGAGRVGGQGR